MDLLLEKIGEVIMLELDEVKDIVYLNELGNMFYIVLNDDKKILLSLIEG